jgi:hypothetical protein
VRFVGYVVEVEQYFEKEFISWTIKRLTKKEVDLLDRFLTSVLGYTPLKELNVIEIKITYRKEGGG